MSEKFKLSAKWTDDCQGKKNYDAEILSISSRYWPRGGGYMMVVSEPGKLPQFKDNDSRPELRPSAVSSLIIRHGEDEEDIELASQEFEADTQEEVQAQVETWAQQIMDRAVAALRKEFSEVE